MKRLLFVVRGLVKDQQGLETVEYAVMAALITGAAILAITALGGAVADKFNALVTLLTS